MFFTIFHMFWWAPTQHYIFLLFLTFFSFFSFLLLFLPQKHPIFGHFWWFFGNVIFGVKRGPGHLKKIAILPMYFEKSKIDDFLDISYTFFPQKRCKKCSFFTFLWKFVKKTEIDPSPLHKITNLVRVLLTAGIFMSFNSLPIYQRFLSCFLY